MKSTRRSAGLAGSVHAMLVDCAAVAVAYWATLAAVARRLP